MVSRFYKRYAIFTVLFTLIIIGIFVPANRYTPIKSIGPFFTLVAKTNADGVRPDYLNFLKQQVARIGINVDVIVQDWPTFLGELIAYHDFDICYMELSRSGNNPDMTKIYTENSIHNYFGYNTNMDYNETLGTGTNEWYMKQGTLIMPLNGEESIHHYWNWEQHLMDKINPLLPTFSLNTYNTYWSNLQGYNFSKGILQSWGKMGFTGTHTGQIDNTELVTHDAAWINLNPLCEDDTASHAISSAVMDPLIWYDADSSVWPHLAADYYMINDTHLRIECREGIKWQEDPDGLFPDEYFDAEDVYFTLYYWRTASSEANIYSLIEDVQIIDKNTIDIFIDGDPLTEKNEPYSPFFTALSLEIVPEHYLNQTQLSDGITPDITHSSWKTFSTKAFGTGLFELGSFTEGVETELTVFDDCWLLDPAVDKSNMDFVNRFGTFAGGLNSWRIRIIPDYDTALSEFEAGMVDTISISSDSNVLNVYESDPDFNVQSKFQPTLSFFGYNLREVRNYIGDSTPCTTDPTITKGLAIRKAISYAIDRDEINDIVNGGINSINYWPIFSTLGSWRNPNIEHYYHNITLAKCYITLAGFDTGVSFPLTSNSILTMSTTLLFGCVFMIAISIIRKKK
ncbi:MAG: ABC transporter substrate-binding protein [Candidatus Thorarchaeota archaeon]